MKFVFVHGWGYDPAFWGAMRDMLARRFPDAAFQCVDLGFLSKDVVAEPRGFGRAIYITHSLGTMWALKYCAPDMQALVALSGFMKFTDFVDVRVLDAMRRRLARDPDAQMARFWDQCGVRPDYTDLNVGALDHGLMWLRDWDVCDVLAGLDVPVLSMAARDDLVAGIDLWHDHWAGHDVCVFDDGGHALPMTQADGCVEAVCNFLTLNGYSTLNHDRCASR